VGRLSISPNFAGIGFDETVVSILAGEEEALSSGL
jgi:hypothetical protein